MLPRILLGVTGILLILLAWGSITSMATFGLSTDSALVLVFAFPLALICVSVAIGLAPFHIRE